MGKDGQRTKLQWVCQYTSGWSLLQEAFDVRELQTSVWAQAPIIIQLFVYYYNCIGLVVVQYRPVGIVCQAASEISISIVGQ